MMTLQQWQNARRVDHISLPGANVRFRGNAGPGPQNLKVLDQVVTDYWQTHGDWVRVQALAEVVQETSAYVAAAGLVGVDQRYITAVRALLTSAEGELNNLCGGPLFQHARTVDLVALHGNQAPAQRTVGLNVYYLAPMGAAPNVGPIDAAINQHIQNANQLACYQRAHLTFQRVNAAATVVSQTGNGDSILLKAVPEVPVDQQGKFADGGIGGQRLATYMNASGAGAHTVDVVYLDNYENAQNDVQGRTYRANDDTFGAHRPIVTITRNPPPGGAATYPTTLAHELGHALTGCPTHIADPNNLMSEGSIRNGTNALTDGQVGWFRNNPWAV